MYSHFVCHHKDGAAAQSRVIQLLIQELTLHDCFIDSDHLVDLDQLYSAVRTCLKTLAIYLTRETMIRPWCVGEMTTAFANEINIVVVHCSSFIPLSDDKLAEPGLEKLLGLGGVALTEQGLSFDEARRALMYVRDLQPHFELKEAPVPADLYIMISEVLSLSVEVRKRDVSMDTLKAMAKIAVAAQHHLEVDTVSDSKNLLLVSDNADPEGTAAAIIMSKMLTVSICGEFLDVRIACNYPTIDLAKLKACAEKCGHCVFMFTTSLLTSPRCLCSLSLAMDDGALVVPVILPKFDFPTPLYFDVTLPQTFAKDSEAIDLLGTFCYTAGNISAHVRLLFLTIGVHFNTHAGIGIIQAQAAELANRFRGATNVVSKQTIAGAEGSSSWTSSPQRSSDAEVVPYRSSAGETGPFGDVLVSEEVDIAGEQLTKAGSMERPEVPRQEESAEAPSQSGAPVAVADAGADALSTEGKAVDETCAICVSDWPPSRWPNRPPTGVSGFVL